ncbi:endonuclease/exonuclease/phosphatase family protein [Singulisphaera rosea]
MISTLLVLVALHSVEQSDVRVMSFNIRYGTADDGENAWDKRKTFLVETIKTFDPDLLGTQETLAGQRDYLVAGLKGYGVVAVGRDDGKDAGEMAAIFYRESRFEKVDGGHFWLSETPEIPGSKSWDSSLTRMVTWVKLRDKSAPDAAPIVYFNTHFDHRGHRARLESARLIRRKIADLEKGARVILTGDFNTGEGTPPHQAIFVEGLRDTYRVAHPTKARGEGTFQDFKAGSTSGARMDWIGCSKEWTVKDAAIDHTSRDGRVPSDHYPVTAVLGPAS